MAAAAAVVFEVTYWKHSSKKRKVCVPRQTEPEGGQTINCLEDAHARSSRTILT